MQIKHTVSRFTASTHVPYFKFLLVRKVSNSTTYVRDPIRKIACHYTISFLSYIRAYFMSHGFIVSDAFRNETVLLFILLLREEFIPSV